MKILLLVVMLLLALSSAHSQNGRSPKETLTINGIGLGSTQSEIVRKFGKPTRIVTKDAGECIGGKMRTLYYPGLKFMLYDDDPGKYTVGEFSVTGAKWSVSGAKIGMSTSAVKKMFGKANESVVESDSGLPTWYYSFPDDNPGSANFSFKKGKVVEIFTGFLMC
jgi:hypothetical protein